MKRLVISTIILISFTFAVGQEISIPYLTGPVMDLSQTLTDNEVILLTNKLTNFETDSLAQMVVLIIPTTGDISIEEFSIKLAENWKIGSADKDDGLIILVAKEDRKVRIEIGYGIEKTFTDADALNIIDNAIIPEFKQGNFFKGISSGVDQVIMQIKGDLAPTYNYIETIYTESDVLFDQDEYEYSEPGVGLILISIFIMIAGFVLPFIFFRKGILFHIILLILVVSTNILIGHYGIGMMMGIIFASMGGLVCFIVLIFKIVTFIYAKRTGKSPLSFFTGGSGNYSGSLTGSSSSSGNWSSSSSNWSSSSGSSGYSGGGGSFGGGGATGSW